MIGDSSGGSSAKQVRMAKVLGPQATCCGYHLSK